MLGVDILVLVVWIFKPLLPSVLPWLRGERRGGALISYNLVCGRWKGEGPSWGRDRRWGEIEDCDAVIGTCGGINIGRFYLTC